LNKHICALLLICMLVISPITVGAVVYQQPHDENLIHENLDEKLQKVNAAYPEEQLQVIRKIQFMVSESFNLGTNDINQEKKTNQENLTLTSRHISYVVTEQFSLSSDDIHKTLAIEKQNSDRKTIMERIWNSEKIRFAGKSFVSENLLQIGPSPFDHSNSLVEELERAEIPSIAPQAEYTFPALTPSSASEITRRETELFVHHIADVP